MPGEKAKIVKKRGPKTKKAPGPPKKKKITKPKKGTKKKTGITKKKQVDIRTVELKLIKLLFQKKDYSELKELLEIDLSLTHDEAQVNKIQMTITELTRYLRAIGLKIDELIAVLITLLPSLKEDLLLRPPEDVPKLLNGVLSSSRNGNLDFETGERPPQLLTRGTPDFIPVSHRSATISEEITVKQFEPDSSPCTSEVGISGEQKNIIEDKVSRANLSYQENEEKARSNVENVYLKKQASRKLIEASLAEKAEKAEIMQAYHRSASQAAQKAQEFNQRKQSEAQRRQQLKTAAKNCASAAASIVRQKTGSVSPYLFVEPQECDLSPQRMSNATSNGESIGHLNTPADSTQIIDDFRMPEPSGYLTPIVDRLDAAISPMLDEKRSVVTHEKLIPLDHEPRRPTMFGALCCSGETATPRSEKPRQGRFSKMNKKMDSSPFRQDIYHRSSQDSTKDVILAHLKLAENHLDHMLDLLKPALIRTSSGDTVPRNSLF